jgi:hypothetical protein
VDLKASLHKASFILYFLEIPFLKVLIIRVKITPKYYIVPSYVALGATQQNLKIRNHHPLECMALTSPDSF